MTHDLVTQIMGELNAHVTKITVTELRDNTFYALITLRADTSEIDVDSRPSDAIALAVRANAPIFAADQVIEDSGIEFPDQPVETEDVVAQFKEFLENVSPEDFAGES
jgi:hypothetical protein